MKCEQEDKEVQLICVETEKHHRSEMQISTLLLCALWPIFTAVEH